jgi:hypothetical protein
LQISAALGVAVIGGVFFSVAGTSPDPVTLARALVVAMMCVGGSLTVSAVLSIVASRSSVHAAASAAPR